VQVVLGLGTQQVLPVLQTGNGQNGVMYRRSQMDSDMKWFLIIMIVLIGAPLLGMGYEQHSHNQCRIEAIKAGVDTDKINSACGIK